jgi:hypothetical protein
MWTITINFFPGHTDQGTITGTWTDADGTFTFSEAGRTDEAGQAEFITHAVTHRDVWKKDLLERKAVSDSLLSLLNAADSLAPGGTVTKAMAGVVDALPDTVSTDSAAEATVRTTLYEKVKLFLRGGV